MLSITDTTVNDDIIATLHAKCDNTDCGGELVCDRAVHRCRQVLDGPCSDDIDCVQGLYCINWICGNKTIDTINDSTAMLTRLSTKRSTVKWADEYKFE